MDGELERELCQQLETHLNDCDRCRIVLDTTKKTIDIYRDQTPMDLPVGERPSSCAAKSTLAKTLKLSSEGAAARESIRELWLSRDPGDYHYHQVSKVARYPTKQADWRVAEGQNHKINTQPNKTN